MSETPSRRFVVLTVLGTLSVTALFIGVALTRPEPPTWPPSPVDPRAVGDTLVGPHVHTVDARDPDRWRFFDFSRASVVDDPSPAGWDLAFRRHRLGVNGGPGFEGRGGVVDLGPVPFDSVTAVPDDGYRTSGPDTVAEALADWYDYSMTSHLLTPKPGVWAVRTADGRFAKIEILGYYCPDAVPGCLTIRWSYQGSGAPAFGSTTSPPSTNGNDEP